MHIWPGLLDASFTMRSTKMDMLLAVLSQRSHDKGVLLVTSSAAFADHAAGKIAMFWWGASVHNLGKPVLHSQEVFQAMMHLRTDIVVAPSDLDVLPLLLARAAEVILLDGAIPDAVLIDLAGTQEVSNVLVTYLRVKPPGHWPLVEGALFYSMFKLQYEPRTARPQPLFLEASVHTPHIEWASGCRTSLVTLSLASLLHASDSCNGAPMFALRVPGLPDCQFALLHRSMLQTIMHLVPFACERMGNLMQHCLHDLAVLNTLCSMSGIDGSVVCTFLLCAAVLRAAGVFCLTELAVQAPGHPDMVFYVLAAVPPHGACIVMGVYAVAVNANAQQLPVPTHAMYVHAIKQFAATLPAPTMVSTHVIRQWLPCGQELAVPAAWVVNF